MAKAGRPRALDDAKKREVAALLSAGCSMGFAARYIGCAAKTIRREAERDTEFGERLRKAQVAAQLEPLQALRKKATTHWRAAAWLLERVDPEQFVRFDQKLYHPQEVADLLENLRATLSVHVVDIPSQIIACGIVDIIVREAGLPRGRRNLGAKLGDLPHGFPEIVGADPMQFTRPAPPEE